MEPHMLAESSEHCSGGVDADGVAITNAIASNERRACRFAAGYLKLTLLTYM